MTYDVHTGALEDCQSEPFRLLINDIEANEPERMGLRGADGACVALSIPQSITMVRILVLARRSTQSPPLYLSCVTSDKWRKQYFEIFAQQESPTPHIHESCVWSQCITYFQLA